MSALTLTSQEHEYILNLRDMMYFIHSHRRTAARFNTVLRMAASTYAFEPEGFQVISCLLPKEKDSDLRIRVFSWHHAM